MCFGVLGIFGVITFSLIRFIKGSLLREKKELKIEKLYSRILEELKLSEKK